MKVILGVDLQQTYLPALHLVARLRIPETEIVLVQTAPAIEATLPPYPIDGAVVDLVQHTLRDAANQALEAAADEVKRLGYGVTTLFCMGPSGEIINELVQDQGAELVALRSMHHGAFQSEFMGSVARVVVFGSKTSVLVAKNELEPDGEINVVFGADGSTFNRRCLERFIRFHPQGIRTVHVVAAWGCATQFEHLLRHSLRHSADVDQHLLEAAELGAKEAAERLSAAGYKTDQHVAHGTAQHVLARAMADTDARLLVIGAHGKGFIERLLIGSTSLHELINEPYNVLLLRP